MSAPPSSQGTRPDEGYTIHQTSQHRSTNENGRKSTLQAIHTDAVNQAVNSQERKNELLDDCPPPINTSEKDLTRKERTTLAQLRSGHCRLLQQQNQEGC